jgi:hypothetical protein
MNVPVLAKNFPARRAGSATANHHDVGSLVGFFLPGDGKPTRGSGAQREPGAFATVDSDRDRTTEGAAAADPPREDAGVVVDVPCDDGVALKIHVGLGLHR